MSHTKPLLVATTLVLVIALVAGLSVRTAAQGGGPGVTITYLYDNTTAAAGMKADWGSACLVETGGRRVLFDTGAKPDVLRANLDALAVDLSKVDALVFSHDHGDHTGGVAALGQRAGLPTFFPASFTEATRARFAAQQFRLVPVTSPTDVAPGVVTGGEIGTAIPEQALVVETGSGLAVIVGCAHPGIVEMLRRISAARGRPIHLVVGGFHLLQTPAEQVRQIVAAFQEMHVAYVGATHCTGEAAIKAFREAYGARFVDGGTGRVLRLPFPSDR